MAVKVKTKKPQVKTAKKNTIKKPVAKKPVAKKKNVCNCKPQKVTITVVQTPEVKKSFWTKVKEFFGF